MRNAVRDAVRQAAGRRDLRRRTPPTIRYEPGNSGTNTGYYVSPDVNSPAGGIRVIYRHVVLLNAAGVDAAVLHGAMLGAALVLARLQIARGRRRD